MDIGWIIIIIAIEIIIAEIIIIIIVIEIIIVEIIKIIIIIIIIIIEIIIGIIIIIIEIIIVEIIIEITIFIIVVKIYIIISFFIKNTTKINNNFTLNMDYSCFQKHYYFQYFDLFECCFLYYHWIVDYIDYY